MFIYGQLQCFIHWRLLLFVFVHDGARGTWRVLLCKCVSDFSEYNITFLKQKFNVFIKYEFSIAPLNWMKAADTSECHVCLFTWLRWAIIYTHTNHAQYIACCSYSNRKSTTVVVSKPFNDYIMELCFFHVPRTPYTHFAWFLN